MESHEEKIQEIIARVSVVLLAITWYHHHLANVMTDVNEGPPSSLCRLLFNATGRDSLDAKKNMPTFFIFYLHSNLCI